MNDIRRDRLDGPQGPNGLYSFSEIDQAIFLKANTLLNQPSDSVDFEGLSNYIQSSAELSRRIIREARKSEANVSISEREVRSVRHAIALLGIQRLKTIFEEYSPEERFTSNVYPRVAS